MKHDSLQALLLMKTVALLSRFLSIFSLLIGWKYYYLNNDTHEIKARNIVKVSINVRLNALLKIYHR